MSDTENQHEQEEHEYQEEVEDDEGVVIDNNNNNNEEQEQEHSQSEQSAQQQQQEDASYENQRYKQHDEGEEEEQFDQQEEDNQVQDQEDSQEYEEKVVRAANRQPVQAQQESNNLQHSQKQDHNDDEHIDDSQREPSFKGDERVQQQAASTHQSQQLQKQRSNHQEKLQQEQQLYQEQQQRQQLQRSKSQQEQILFSQFLNEILDQYRTTANAFKAIDRHKKGFIELHDLAIEIAARFGIENESQQKEIFVKLGHGNPRINRELFDEAFHDIVQDRHQQQQQLLSSMNVVTQSFDPSHSPFKDKQERDDIINVFANDKGVNLDEENKVEHFGDDCLYAPVVRRLRQQPNFNEFVRSYNSLQFPKHPSQQANSQQGFYQPFSQLHSLQYGSNNPLQQQSLLKHELFSNTSSGNRNYRGAQSLLDEYRQSAPPLQSAHPNSGSPLRQLKISTHTFSPNRFYKSLDSPKDFAFERRQQNQFQNMPRTTTNQQRGSAGKRFMSPQYNRKPNQTFLGFEFGPQNYQSQILGNPLRQSQGNYLFGNNANNSRLFASQEINLNKDNDFLHKSSYLGSPLYGAQTYNSGNNPLFQSINVGGKSSNSNNLFSLDKPLTTPQLAQSYIGNQPRIDLKLSPNQNRLNKLKRNVNQGLEGLAQINKPFRLDGPSGLNTSSLSSNNNSRSMKDQLNQYISQLGASNYNPNNNVARAQPSPPQRYRNNSKPSNAYPLSLEDDGNRFGDILSRLNGVGTGKAHSRASLEKRRQNRNMNLDFFGNNTIGGGANASPFRNNSYKKSQSPTQFNLSPSGPKGGVVGQMQRVKQIQASLRALPNKQKVKFSRTGNSKGRSSGNYYDKNQ